MPHPVTRRQFLRAASLGTGALALPAFGKADASRDWPCFRGPNHDGTLDEQFTLVTGEPEVLWRAKVGKGNASLAIVGGRLFTSSEGGSDSVTCLDARTGAKVWAASLNSCDAGPTPTVAGGRVFLPFWGRKGPGAAGLSAEDGRLLWEAALPASTGKHFYGIAGSVRAWEDLAFLNLAGGAAVKQDSGEVVWAHEGHTAYATPVVFTAKGKPAVAFFTGDSLIAREARAGTELWRIPWKTSLHVSACDPLFLGDRVFLCSHYGRGRALYDVAGETPRVVWEEHRDGSGNTYASGFRHGAGVYVFTADGFASLNAADGSLRWETPGWGRAVVVGGTLFWLMHKGELRAGPLDPERKFTPMLTAQLIGGTTNNGPAYWDKKLYLRNEGGEIACLRVGQ